MKISSDGLIKRRSRECFKWTFYVSQPVSKNNKYQLLNKILLKRKLRYKEKIIEPNYY